MPDSNEILNEIRNAGSTHDIIRRNYLGKLHEVTGRNIIIYYSGWTQRTPTQLKDAPISIESSDINRFMTVLHKLDHSKGLDLILHTPGGDPNAAESLVNYLRSLYKTDIRAFVPQQAMSAGTMIACACKEIYMGKHSNLGPIDPQVNGIAAHGVIEEFNRAQKEIIADRNKAIGWKTTLEKYPPGFLIHCEKAIALTNEMVAEWLCTGMFEDDTDAKEKSERIVGKLTNYKDLKSHARSLPPHLCKNYGLKICNLESNPVLQDAVLSVHHATIQTFDSTPAIKIVENHTGKAAIQIYQQNVIPQVIARPPVSPQQREPKKTTQQRNNRSKRR